MSRDFSKLHILLEAFFTDHLMKQRRVSTHTLLSYRDTFRLLLGFAERELKRQPATLTIDDLNVGFIKKFLIYLESERKISARTRNQRLAAIRSCVRYAALYLPEKSHLLQQILALPSKRYERRMVQFLDGDEISAILASPDTKSWSGRRDIALIRLAVQTGLRVSELTQVRRRDLHLRASPHVRCMGKGRKERCTPLTKETARALRQWLGCAFDGDENLVFTNARGKPLSTDGVQYILDKHVRSAVSRCPSLAGKRVTPHVLRHTAAMQLFHAGVDRTVIALWLGHESVETTLAYLEADLKMKEKAARKTSVPETSYRRFKAKDALLAFLSSL